MVQVYKTVTSFEKILQEANSLKGSLSSMTSEAVRLTDESSSLMITSDSRGLAKNSIILNDVNGQIKITCLPIRSAERFEIKVKNQKQRFIRGYPHEEIVRNIEFENYLELEEIMSTFRGEDIRISDCKPYCYL